MTGEELQQALTKWRERHDPEDLVDRPMSRWPVDQLRTLADKLDTDIAKKYPECDCLPDPFTTMWTCPHKPANPYRTAADRKDARNATARSQRASSGGRAKSTPTSPEVTRHEQRQADHVAAEAVVEPPGPDPDPDPGPLPGTTDDNGWPIAVTPIDWTDVDNAELPALLHSQALEHGLLYRHGVNWLTGRPKTGKTWLALLAALEVVAEDALVLWIMGGEDLSPLHQRCAQLGCAEAVNGITALTGHQWATAEPEDRAAMLTWLGDGLMVIDSARSTGAGQQDWTLKRWLDLYLGNRRPDRPLPGVIVIDHVPKRLLDGERIPGAIGTQDKLGAADMSLNVEGVLVTLNGDATITTGRAALIVDGARHGGGHGHVATATTTMNGPTLTITIEAPNTDGGDLRALTIAAVRDTDGIGKTALRDAISTAAKLAFIRVDWQILDAEIAAAIKAKDIIEDRDAKGAKIPHHLPPGQYL